MGPITLSAICVVSRRLRPTTMLKKPLFLSLPTFLCTEIETNTTKGQVFYFEMDQVNRLKMAAIIISDFTLARFCVSVSWILALFLLMIRSLQLPCNYLHGNFSSITQRLTTFFFKSNQFNYMYTNARLRIEISKVTDKASLQ